MIPSDFNQDAVMQRRWTKRLLESVQLDEVKRRKLIVSFPSTSARDAAIKAVKADQDLPATGSALFKGAGPENGAVFMLRDPHLKVSLVTRILDKHRGRVVTNTVEGVLNERDATLEKGETISGRRSGSGTWISVERISGKKYGVFRSFKKLKKIGKRPSTMLTVPDEDAFAGPGSDPWGFHPNRDSALRIAREIAEKTGERVMIEDHKGGPVKMRLAFEHQTDAKVFMSKFNFNSLFGGGSLGKDLSPAGRAFTRIDLGKKSPFMGSEAYEQKVAVSPERLKAFLWLLGEFGGAIL